MVEKSGHASGDSMDFRKAREQWLIARNDLRGVPSRFDEIGSRLNARPDKKRIAATPDSRKRKQQHEMAAQEGEGGGIVGIRKKDDSRPSNDPSAFCPFAFSYSALLSLSLFLSLLLPLPYQKNWSDVYVCMYVCSIRFRF